jgi:hypothetical protein
MTKTISSAFACLLALVIGCSEEEPKEEPEPEVCDPTVANPGCHENRICERTVGGEPKCQNAYFVVGRVFDSVTDQPIEGARIVARDVNGAAVSGVVHSNLEGNYRLPVPVERNADGAPAASKIEVFLRADAHAYATFPKPPRSALPIDVLRATGSPLELKTAATDIALVALDNAAGLGTIAGTVKADAPGGALVVAGGASGIADLRGDFAIFNVPVGGATVRGYLTGVNLEEKTVDVAAGQTTRDVVLEKVGDATASVSGTLNFVDPGSGITSVILVVADTFQENVARGETPPGLKTALDVTGPFEIENVPDGTYKVLAAFENDGFVRDPDTSLGGTAIVEATVSGSSVALTQSFKVTGALAVRSPDDEELVTGTPTFVWQNDNGEAGYEVLLYDALGNEIWSKKNLPAATKDVSQPYDGDLSLLKPGMIYQFRAFSLKAGGSPLSSTEDLKGVFIYEE